MRLWSIHPAYLDSLGLVALWREALLARKVLQGRTIGYRHHPQLDRFRSQSSPVGSINGYLHSIWDEASRRGYAFDKDKVGARRNTHPIVVSSGQIRFEMSHLQQKLRGRNRKHLRSIGNLRKPVPHPLFRVKSGPVEAWEKSGSKVNAKRRTSKRRKSPHDTR